jgi:hypothetical protein
VFIVGCFGKPCPAEVLFESEGGEGDFAQSGETRPELAFEIAASLRGVGGGPRGFNLDAEQGLAVTVGTLKAGTGGFDIENAAAGYAVAFHENKSGNIGPAGNARALRSGASHSYQFVASTPGEHIVSVRIAQTSSNGWGISEDGRTHTLDSTGGDAICAPADPNRVLPTAGISRRLDDTELRTLAQRKEIADACSQEADTRKILRELRGEVGEEAFAAWGAGIIDSFPQAQILRSEVLWGGHQGPEKRSCQLEHGALSRPENMSERLMRPLWQAGRQGRTPQEWKLAGQLAGELGAYLSALPHEGARLERNRRCCQCGESEKGQCWPVLPQGLDSARYRALGNAVTANVAQWIATRIKESLKGKEGA